MASASPYIELAGHRASGKLLLKPIAEADVPLAAALETASYPKDEAASPERLAWRHANAGRFFWGVYADDTTKSPQLAPPSQKTLVGFICGTLTSASELTHESMALHETGGATLCIHSVVTAPGHRRKGVAKAALQAYADAINSPAFITPGGGKGEGGQPVAQILLIAKAGLLRLYVAAGFQLVGLSPVVHGADPWFELRRQNCVLDQRSFEFVQVDAFAAEALGGNPAAVVFVEERHRKAGSASGWPADEWLQGVADEFHLSETAFVRKRSEPSGEGAADPSGASAWDLRWFTPSSEVDLCGHGTLAAAHAVLSTHRAPEKQALAFYTRSGVLMVRPEEAAGPGWLAMDFPAEPPTEVAEPRASLTTSLPTSDEKSAQKASPAAAAAAALALTEAEVLWVGRNRMDLLVEVAPEAFAKITPDLARIKQLDSRGLIVTAAPPRSPAGLPSCPPEGLAVDFVSRFFGPNIAIDEDPVTGSAHCALGPYWAAKKGGASVLIGWQASKRGGAVRVEVKSGAGRVVLSGPATTTMEGTLKA